MAHTQTNNLHLPVYYTPGEQYVPPLMRDISSANEVIDRVITELQAETRDYPTIVSEIQTLKNLLSALAARVAENTSDIAILQPEVIDDLKETVEALEEKVNANAQNIGTFNARLDVLSGNVSDVTSDLETTKTRIDGIETELARYEEANDEAVSSISSRVGVLETKQESQEALNLLTDSRLDDLEQNMRNALTDIHTNATNITTLSEAVQNHETRIEALENA